ncbi:MAG TPA: two-component regulator propeller domain-containing protein [Hanamia sp.]
MDSEGKLWLLTHQDLFSYDTRSHILKKYKNDSLQTDKFISIAADKNGRVWCGTNKGNLYYCSEQSKELSFAGNINKISGIQNILELRCLYIDQSNLLWIGTEGGGVIQLDLNPKNFNNFPSSQNNTQNSLYIKSIFCDDDGKVWLGTFKKGIYILDPETRKAVKFQIPKNKVLLKNDENIFSINKDANGIYWFGYNGVLVAYNKKENQFYFHQVPLNFPNTYLTINQIRIRKGGLLLSTTIGLFEVITSPRGDKTLFKQILNTAVSESFMTLGGALWASSLYIGLIKINTDSVNSYTNHLSDNGFRCLTEDTSHQILWAASQNGLLAYHLPTGKYKYYTEENGLLNGYLYGIIETGNEIWMSSNKGLARGIITYKKGNTFPEIAFKCYTKDDGLQSDEFNTGAYAMAKDGTIYFGGINGLNWFKPEKIYTNKLKPSVAIIGLEINDTAFFKISSPEYLQTLTTLFKNNIFTIKFIGLEFSNPQGIHYRFKMEDLENGWSTEKHSREVRYANLPPGQYIFRLAAANSDDVWSDEVRLSISILPPFYSTWWFRLIIIVILLSAVIFVTQKISRFKLKKKIRLLEKQKALEDERNRISKEMHDDLGAGLTQISLISEAAKRRNKAGRFPGDELNDISKTSKQLIENVSEIIWAMNPEFDTLSSMIAYLREQLSKLLEYSGKLYYIQLPEVYTDMNIANSKRKNISILLKEAVNNAIKHSNATSIYVKIVLINDQLQIEIKDNGQGFDVNNVSTGNGIKNYSFRTGLLNGTSNVISDNSGTEVYFRIPLLD